MNNVSAVSIAKSPLIVPRSASKGLVAPTNFLIVLIASSHLITIARDREDVMYSIKLPKNGLSAYSP